MDLDNILRELTALTDAMEHVAPIIPPLNAEVQFNTPMFALESQLKKFPFNLNIGHINTVSIPKRRDELFRIIKNFQIFGVSETNFKSNTPQCLIDFEGFKFFGCNRNKGRCGGVGLYINDQFKTKRVYFNYKHPQPEMVFVECTFRNTVILVGVIYKSPSISYKKYEEILEIIATITTKYTNVILLGDYNINFLKPNLPETKFFKNEILEPFGLKQIVEKPTRVTDKSQTLIDLILVNNPTMVSCTDVIEFAGASDHCLVFLSYAVKRPKYKAKTITRRDFRKFNEANFNEDIESINWENVHAERNDTLCNDPLSSGDRTPLTILNNKITAFENYFIDACDKHAPYREVKIKKPVNPSWMSDDILQKMDSRDLYKKYFSHTNDIYYLNKYKELKNIVNHAIRRAKIADFNAKINSKLKNIKQFHLNLKSLNVVNNGIKNNNFCSFSPTDLNNFFASYNNAHVDPLILAEELKRISQTKRSQKTFVFKDITVFELKKVVSTMKSNSCGIDKISIFFLKTAINTIGPIIADIFNFSLKNKIFPNRWKTAIIKPIPKVNNPTKLKDYRPISLLTTLSKIFEKLVSDQMKKHFLDNSLMNKNQSGYKPHHSCTTALLHISDYIYDAMDNGEIVFLVLLDYSKAFDLANHNLIIAKLRALGFDESALDWLKSYLDNRKQKVLLDSDESSLIELENGVPQGSILGPLLFTILVNDISDVIRNCQYHLYADDTQLYLKTKVDDAVETIVKINDDLNRIAKFSQNNSLKINEDKSKFLVFGSKNNLARLSKVKQIALAEIHMNNFPIERVSVARNLGIIFDERMSWESHVKNLICRAYYRLKLAYRNSRFLTEESKICVVETYILALFNFGCPVLQNLSSKTAGKIQKLQNACIRFIFNLRKFDHLTPYFKKIKMLRMDDRRDIQSLTIVHNILNGRAPDYLIDKVEFNYVVHDHDTRIREGLRVPRAKTMYGQNRFFRKQLQSYNDIKKAIKFRQNISTATFKYKVKKHILSLKYKD